MAGGAAARQGDSRRCREGAPDTARRSADDLRGRGDAVWLRRVHPPRDLAGDAARDDAEQALVPSGTGKGKGKGRRPLSLPPLCAQTNRTLAALNPAYAAPDPTTQDLTVEVGSSPPLPDEETHARVPSTGMPGLRQPKDSATAGGSPLKSVFKLTHYQDARRAQPLGERRE